MKKKHVIFINCFTKNWPSKYILGTFLAREKRWRKAYDVTKTCVLVRFTQEAPKLRNALEFSERTYFSEDFLDFGESFK